MACTSAPTPSPTNSLTSDNTNLPSNANISISPPGFKPICTNPRFPEPAPTTDLGIDSQCGNEGSGEEQSEQNLAKNNFCADGTPSETSIADFQKLQQSVEKDPSISFGPLLPTTNRTALQTLGEGKLVTLKAFVLKARQEGGESVNCGSKVSYNSLFHDIHITLVDAPNRPQGNDSKSVLAGKECTGVVVEMSPHHRPDVWTADNINEVAKSRALIRVTGQQFFDSSHVPCSNGAPVGNSPKRISLWEIHPVYEFEVCTANCTRAAEWVPLDQWVKQHQSSDRVAVKKTDGREIKGLSQMKTTQNYSSPTQTTEIVTPILGNKRSMIYHWPGCPDYDKIALDNRVPFGSREDAEKAGYRAARNCR